MKQSSDFLGTESIGKLLFRLGLPTVAAQLINMLYNIVDRIYIGHMPGDGKLALTGVGICLPLIMIVSAFAALVSSGGAPRASIFMGQGKNEESEKTMNACFCLQLIVSLVLTALLLCFGRPLLMAFGASENTIGYAVEYMNTYALGTLFVQLTLGMNAYITAQGFAKTGMYTVLIGALCNILLDPLFIYGFHMGVRGAALATILSQGISCAWVLMFLCGRRSQWRLRPRLMRLQSGILFPCLALGMASFIMQSTESLIAVCFNASLLRFGGDIAVGAMTILTSVMQFAMMPLQGLGAGSQPIISFNYGAGNTDRVKKTYFLLLKVSLIYSSSLWLWIQLCPRMFAGLFTADPELLLYAARMLRIYCAVLFMFGVQVACQMAFVSIGYAKSSILVACMRKIVLLLPLIVIMPRLFPGSPATAVFAAEPVADFLAVSFTGLLFFFQFRRVLKEMQEKKTLPEP